MHPRLALEVIRACPRLSEKIRPHPRLVLEVIRACPRLVAERSVGIRVSCWK